MQMQSLFYYELYCPVTGLFRPVLTTSSLRVWETVMCWEKLHSQWATIILLMSQASRLQRHFRTTTIYKRSKQYFDIDRLNRIEQLQQLHRRKPREPSETSVDSKFEQTFCNTDARLNERVQTELEHRHLLFCKEEDATTNCSLQTEPKLRGRTLDMSKMLPREYFQHSPPPRDESQFCNFAVYVPSHCTIEFDRTLPHHAPPHKHKAASCSRHCDTLAPRLQLESEKLGRAKEKIVFNDAALRAIADYKKYGREKPEKPAEQTRDRDWERIRMGEELTRKTCSTAMGEFYHGVHKWTTPQMDMRLRRGNEDYQRAENRLAEARVEWSITKRREDMIEQRKKEILGRKRIKDVKGEICDEKYFLRNKIEV